MSMMFFDRLDFEAILIVFLLMFTLPFNRY